MDNTIHNLNFNSIYLKPHSKLWNNRVLNSVIKSKTINNIIKDNEAHGLDTFIEYRKTESDLASSVLLNIKSPKNNLTLESNNKVIIKNNIQKGKIAYIEGPLHIIDDLVKQIKHLDILKKEK